jgi:PAS domain S-box-containing protein
MGSPTMPAGPGQPRLASLTWYGLAVLSVGIAIGAALILDHFHFRDAAVPLLLFACAISSWYGGRGPALLAFTLATAGFYWYFIEPVRTIYILPSEIPYFIIFAAFASLIAWFSAVRRRSEQALREQAALLDLTHDTVFVMDLEGVIKYWNRGAEERYGWTAKQALGRGVHDLLKTVFPAPLEEIKAQLERDGRWEGELLHTKEDGTRVLMASRWALQRGKKGAPVAILETSNDITERKRAEERIQQQQIEQQQILNLTPQLVAVFGTDRKRLWANRPSLDYFGVSLEEWQSIPDRFWFFHPDDQERVSKDVYAGPAGDVPHEFEARLRRKDGTYRWFLFRDSSLRDEQGSVVRWYLTATDIEDRKRAEEERQAQVWFLEGMDRINRAMQGTNDLEEMTGNVIEAMLSIFDSERAFLYYPCDPNAPSFEVVMDRARLECPKARGAVPMTPDTARGFQIVLASNGVVTFGPGCDHPLIGDFVKRFGHKSSIGIALYPKTGKPWVLTMHQYSHPRVWTPHEKKLLEEIGRRMTDSLTSLLMFRSLRESEQALRRTAAYLADAQKLAHTGAWAADGTTAPLYWSEEVFRIFGFDPRQGLPTRDQPLERIHPEDLDEFLQDFYRTINEKVDSEGEYRVVLPDGTLRHIHAVAHPVLDPNGELVEVVGTVADITERKRAEEALRLSNAYNRSLIEISLDPLVTIGPDGKITDVNAATEAATGRSRRELIGTDFCDYFTEPAQARAGYEQAFREGLVRDCPLELRHRDGRVMSVLYNASVYRDESGQVSGVFAAARDITERKRAEEALRESETRFRTFVDHATDAFFMLEFEQGTIIDVNRCACESLGYTREELLGKTPMVFDVSLDRVAFESMVERTAAGRNVWFDRHWHRRKDRSLFPVEVQTSAFWRGGRRFLLKVARDISDRLRAEEQRERLRQIEADLAHINRVSMMGELTASIAHEVNQPLSGVVANGSACLRWLAGNAPNMEEAREAARRIVRDGKRAGEIIARIRSLTRRAELPREKLDLNETIRDVLAIVGDEAKRKGVTIRTQFAGDVFPVLGDRVQLQQVALNLVMNAIEAMGSVEGRAREVAIATRNMEPDRALVTVEDSGAGLDPNLRDKIFDPFYTTKPEGMGMGLTISRSILQAHGGRLWATAKEGPGTVFQFTLPKYNEEESNAGPAGA